MKSKYLMGGVRVKDYPKQPSDYSESTQEKCQHCDELFWFSEKKKDIMKHVDPECVFLACLSCCGEELKKSNIPIEKINI